MKIEINILQYKEYSSDLPIMSGTTTEQSSASSTSSTFTSDSSNTPQRGSMTIDIRPMIEDVSQVMTKHITNILSGVIGEYTVYKETHDTIMGLPCVRKLQERIDELEQTNNNTTASTKANNSQTSTNREDEVAQLQSAIAELNRYIHALESKVDMKSTIAESESNQKQDNEESVKLEIHEKSEGGSNTYDEENPHDSTTPCVISPMHKNVIVSSETLEENVNDDQDNEVDEKSVTEGEDENEDEDEGDNENEDEGENENEDEGKGDDDGEGEDDDDGEGEDEEPTDITQQEKEQADDEEEEPADDEEEEPADEKNNDDVVPPVEEAEIEVSEVKIKGKTYFTTDPINGVIYACVDDDVGDEVGVFKNGVAMFNKGKK